MQPRCVLAGFVAACSVSAPALAQEKPKDTPEEAKEDAKQAEKALVSHPQVTAIRGGTLGIPSATTSRGFQAAVDAKTDVTSEAAEEGDSTTFDFYAKLGRLTFTKYFEAEVLAEQFEADLPQATVGMPGALATSRTLAMNSIGLRLAFRTKAREWNVVEIPSGGEAGNGDQAAKQTVQNLVRGTSGFSYLAGVRVLRRDAQSSSVKDFDKGAAFELVGQYSQIRTPAIDTECKRALTDKATSAKDRLPTARETVTKAQQAVDSLKKQRAELTADGPARDKTIADLLGPNVTSTDAAVLLALADDKLAADIVDAEANLRAAKKTLQDLEKQEAADPAEECEGAVDADEIRMMGFGSVSGTYLRQELRMIDDATVDFPEFREVRLTVGIDFQTASLFTEQKFLPRFGAYASVAWGDWNNAYAAPGMEKDIDARQWQAAVYVSGHFYGGASGLLSFGILQPYGHDARPQFVISFSPSLTATSDGGESK
jgi:hypothetical protein